MSINCMKCGTRNRHQGKLFCPDCLKKHRPLTIEPGKAELELENKRLRKALRYIVHHRTSIGGTLIEMIPEPKRTEIIDTLEHHHKSTRGYPSLDSIDVPVNHRCYTEHITKEQLKDKL